MFDKDINNSIRKGIKIGKWFIGTTIIINIAIWTIIGFFTYKYIYIDHIASKYSGPEHEEEVIVEKFKAVHSFEKGLKKLLPNILITDSSIGNIEDTDQIVKNFNDIRYSKLQKDEFGRPILKVCGNIPDEIVDEVVNNLEIIRISKEFINSKNSYLNKVTQTRFLSLNCDTALIQITGEMDNGTFKTLERITISLGDKLNDLSLNLQRIKNQYARLDRWTELSNNEELFYHYKTGNYIYVNKKLRIITIYTKKYIEDIFNVLVKEIGNGDSLQVINLSWALDTKDKNWVNKEKIRNFYEVILENNGLILAPEYRIKEYENELIKLLDLENFSFSKTPIQTKIKDAFNTINSKLPNEKKFEWNFFSKYCNDMYIFKHLYINKK